MRSFGDLFQPVALAHFLLIVFRVLGVFMAAPLLGNKSVPNWLKVSLALFISLILYPLTNFHDSFVLQSDLRLIQLVLQEATIGLVIGFVAATVFYAVQIAGEIFGVKIGFSIAQVIDPQFHGASSVLANFYVVLGAVIFLFLNGHHLILSAAFDSFRILPVGSGISFVEGLHFGTLVTKIMMIAIKIAAPVIVVITLLNFIFGFLTKLSPQMNIYFNAGFIVTPVLGLITMVLSLPLFRVLMSTITSTMGDEMTSALKQMKGM